MRFSVLIPVYKNDRPDQLIECFESIDKQTRSPDEVLVLVDGPVSDDLRKVIDESSYKIHYFEKNRGLPLVLNDGIRLANYEWIFRMDADDVAALDRFSKQVQFIESHPDVTLMGGQVQEFSGSVTNLLGVREVPLEPKEIRSFGRWRNPFNHPTVAYRKDIAERLGGYNGRSFSFEDHELWMRFIADGQKVANIPDVLVYMRINDSFFMRRSGKSYIKNEYHFLKRLHEIGIISYPYLLLLCAVRLPIRLLPVPVLRWMFQTFLRKS